MGIFDDLKNAAKILQEAGKIEQYKKILEAQKELLDMQKKIDDLEEENRELKKKLKIKESVAYRNNAYWVKKSEKEEDGPFCSRCYDKDKDLIRMQPCGNPEWGECPECNNRVQTTKGSTQSGVVIPEEERDIDET